MSTKIKKKLYGSEVKARAETYHLSIYICLEKEGGTLNIIHVYTYFSPYTITVEVTLGQESKNFSG